MKNPHPSIFPYDLIGLAFLKDIPFAFSPPSDEYAGKLGTNIWNYKKAKKIKSKKIDSLIKIRGVNMKNLKSSFTVFNKKLPSISCYKALIVDDYGPAKKLLGASLSALPQIGEIDYASSGEEALAKVVSKKYDIIYLDVSMPGLDGFETCAFIREIEGYELTPIIMVSGSNSRENEFKGVISGCTSYVTKPIQQEPFKKLSMKMFSWLEEYQAA